MGCAVGTVKSQVSAGLAKLRARLDDDVALPSPGSPGASCSSRCDSETTAATR